jgi:hypothetical protein
MADQQALAAGKHDGGPIVTGRGERHPAALLEIAFDEVGFSVDG